MSQIGLGSFVIGLSGTLDLCLLNRENCNFTRGVGSYKELLMRRPSSIITGKKDLRYKKKRGLSNRVFVYMVIFSIKLI